MAPRTAIGLHVAVLAVVDDAPWPIDDPPPIGSTIEAAFAYALAIVSRVEAALGREQDCRAHLARALVMIDQLENEILRSYVSSRTELVRLVLSPASTLADADHVRVVHGGGNEAAADDVPILGPHQH